MHINNIKGFTYFQFNKNVKEIEKSINKYFQGKEMDIQDMYKELNFLLWGLDITKENNKEILEKEYKYIKSPFQEFYVKKDKAFYAIHIDFAIKLPDEFFDMEINEDDFKITDIKIRILK